MLYNLILTLNHNTANVHWNAVGQISCQAVDVNLELILFISVFSTLTQTGKFCSLFLCCEVRLPVLVAFSYLVSAWTFPPHLIVTYFHGFYLKSEKVCSTHNWLCDQSLSAGLAGVMSGLLETDYCCMCCCFCTAATKKMFIFHSYKWIYFIPDIHSVSNVGV